MMAVEHVRSMNEDGGFVLYSHETAWDGAALNTRIQIRLFPNLFRGSVLKPRHRVERSNAPSSRTVRREELASRSMQRSA
jgi:hypothetical protein